MTPDRWQQVEALFHEVLELNPAERAKFLESVDPELRQQLEPLLRNENSHFLVGRHAFETIHNIMVDGCAPGVLIGPYQIEALVGKGGMGQVFRAKDTRLGRQVAIKISSQLDRRFEREARTIAALNHPHICTLYDVGANYLVMEFCEGQTLTERLQRGRLSIADTLRIGTQIADAVAAAHSKGIVHRDLKPGNIMLLYTGAKVLDFGLARVEGDERLTGAYAVMGTPAYMAPEQRQGRTCDARTDIYALGLMLHEMSTGIRLAVGETPTTRDLPEKLAHVIERCLAVDPEERFQTAKDVHAELRWAAQAPQSANPPRRSRPGIWMAAGIAALSLAAASIVLLRPAAPSGARPSQFLINAPVPAERTTTGTVPTPSPDGRFLVYLVNNGQHPSLWLRALDAANPHEVAGTIGSTMFFWSPDSRWIGFFADGKLKKVGPDGGSPQTIATLPEVQEAAWSSSGDILYRPSNRLPLWRISASGGAPVPVTHLDQSRTENSHRGLQFLPDGRRFLFTARCSKREFNALYLGSLDSSDVKRIMPVDSNAFFLPANSERSALLLSYRDGGMVAQSFDPDSATVSGAPFPVVENVEYLASSIAAYFRVSADGQVAVIRPSGADRTQLLWVDRNGKESGEIGLSGYSSSPHLSPDGRRVLFVGPDPQTGNKDLFVTDFQHNTTTRLTTNVANDWFPVWSPDGKRILFGSDRDGTTSMLSYLKSSMEPNGDEIRFTGEEPVDWSRDGRWLAFDKGARDIWIAPAESNAQSFPYLATPALELGARFSPDGKWLAYVSNESGRYEVYVRPFQGGPAREGRIQISNQGGDIPIWRPDGKELYFVSYDRQLNAVDTKDLGRASLPPPVRLFEPCPGRTLAGAVGVNASYSHPYDTDGKRFLVACKVEADGQFLVLLNWPFDGKRQ